MLFRLTNLAAFQAQWFLSVLGAAREFAWAGLAFGLGWICVHVWWITASRGQELASIGFAFAFGLSAETLLASAGLLEMSGAYHLGVYLVLPPFWLPVLWAGLGATINHSLGWLSDRYALATAMGALAGPFAYASAEHLGAVHINGPVGLFAVSAMYAVATPAMLAVAQRARRDSTSMRIEAAQ